MTDASELARALFDARRDRKPIPPLSETVDGLTIADAYAVQRAFVERLRDGNDTPVVGYKLGLTSKPMQELLGVDQPDFGPVLRSMVHDDGAALAVDDLIQPKIEAEVGLVLDRDLRGPGVTTWQAASAVGGAIAVLEVVDSRIEDWRITIVDTIADLASSAAIVMAPRVVPVAGIDLRTIGMVIRSGGRVQATGAGAAAMGDPAAAVAWLANTLATFDVALTAGDVIMTGALHAAFPVAAGDVIRADIDRLGSVTARFV
ncbi:MAG: fumarylacetoacetate hydrolase family protein [Actinobacteria bacterium]|nr:fumarylacetoacetate hydrolase family protein [Actinomycetota bacterium]